MHWLLDPLSSAIQGSPLIAMSAAAAWGVLSVVLSPCHLACIPLIIGFISGQQGKASTWRAFSLATLFALGILITIAAIGVLTSAAGKIVGDVGVGPWATYFVAVVFFAIGLHLLGVIPMPWSGPRQTAVTRKGLLAALLMGVVFGVGLGPCTFAFMAPVLGVTYTVAETAPVYAVVLLLMFGLGHCAVIAAAGTCTGLVQRYLNWTERSKSVVRLRAVCGVLVILGGVYLVYIA